MCNDEYRELADHPDRVAGRARASNCSPLMSSTGSPPGGRWHCADGCGNARHGRGPVGVAAGRGGRPGRAPALCAARRAAGGHRRRRSGPQRRAGRRHRQQAGTADRPDADGASRRRDGDRRGRAGGRRAATCPMTQLARLACALTDPRCATRSTRWRSVRTPEQAESLWAELSRTLPEPWRVEALVLLAFSAYARGDGPLAGVSLDAALRCDATHRMAGMLDTALQSGMRPEQIRDLAHDRIPVGRPTGRAAAAEARVRARAPGQAPAAVRPFRPSRRAPSRGAARPARGPGSRS